MSATFIYFYMPLKVPQRQYHEGSDITDDTLKIEKNRRKYLRNKQILSGLRIKKKPTSGAEFKKEVGTNSE